MASLAEDMKEIRELDKSLIEKDFNVIQRIEKLNETYADWVFTKDPGSFKILANRVEDLFGNSIEV